eukprot:SM000176S03135  [mRNA]  locus=s176:172210:172913:+ [translate_table: standard]
MACECGGREFYRPVWQITVSSCWILALEWIAYPRCLIAGLEDGKVRTLALDLAVSFLPACESLPTTAAGHAFSSHPCLPSAIWALVVSRQTGNIEAHPRSPAQRHAYCMQASKDTSLAQAELTQLRQHNWFLNVELKPSSRSSYFACGGRELHPSLHGAATWQLDCFLQAF